MLNELDLPSEGGTDPVRQDGHAILATLSASDRDLCEIEVDVLDPQGQRFAHPNARPIDRHPDEAVLPGQMSEQALDLSGLKNAGQALGFSGPGNGVDILDLQHFSQEERESGRGLVSALGREGTFRLMVEEPLNVKHPNRLDRDRTHELQESTQRQYASSVLAA